MRSRGGWASPVSALASHSTAAVQSFEQLYAGLAGVLDGAGGVVAAGKTPLGRGLVAQQPIAQGSTLLSGGWAGTVHALLAAECTMARSCQRLAASARRLSSPTRAASPWPAVDWCNLLAVTDQPSKTGNAFGRRVLEDWQLLHGRLPPLLQRYLLAEEGDWFLRLSAWLLWLRRNATGPWRVYVDLLPKARAAVVPGSTPGMHAVHAARWASSCPRAAAGTPLPAHCAAGGRDDLPHELR